MYYVYVLLCSDQRYYVGCCDDLRKRIERHLKGNVPATSKRLPILLHSYHAFQDKYKAFAFEKYLKSGSGRAFIARHFV